MQNAFGQGKIIYAEVKATDYYCSFFSAVGCSPGGSRSCIDTDKERIYIKGTIQNKVYNKQGTLCKSNI
jgi:hypothetical protein